MPVSKVEVSEYRCIRCGHKWINRFNGREGTFPKKCAKCKRANWNRDMMTPKEHGLRRRIKGLKSIYKSVELGLFDRSIVNCWSHELAEEFLNLKPRPTEAELERVVNPPGLVIDYLTSQNELIRRSSYVGYVRDPREPGNLKFDKAEYIKIVKQEAQKRQEIMREIMKSRHG